MAENLEGSFAITILNQDNSLYLVKGCNPIYLVHFKSLGLYLYSSTKEIIKETLYKSHFNYNYEIIRLIEEDILKINPDGSIEKDYFNSMNNLHSLNNLNYYCYDEELENLLEISSCFGITEDEIYQLLDNGYQVDEIEYIIQDKSLFQTALKNFY